MGISKYEKLKKLTSAWPVHAVVTSSWLHEKGFSASNIQKYIASKWIKSLGVGAYKLADSEIEWKGAVFGLQHPFKNGIHVGGLTSLELLGAAHFLQLGSRKIFLYSSKECKLPKWFKNGWGKQSSLSKAKCFRKEIGLETYHCGDFDIHISSRERAIMETIYTLNKHHSFEECFLLMENLTNLRPKLIQELLENCSSIKIKRVFLFLAEKTQHKWLNELDLSKINLGKGDRKLVENGTYDSMYKITYPRGFLEDDRPHF